MEPPTDPGTTLLCGIEKHSVWKAIYLHQDVLDSITHLELIPDTKEGDLPASIKKILENESQPSQEGLEAVTYPSQIEIFVQCVLRMKNLVFFRFRSDGRVYDDRDVMRPLFSSLSLLRAFTRFDISTCGPNGDDLVPRIMEWLALFFIRGKFTHVRLNIKASAQTISPLLDMLTNRCPALEDLSLTFSKAGASAPLEPLLRHGHWNQLHTLAFLGRFSIFHFSPNIDLRDHYASFWQANPKLKFLVWDPIRIHPQEIQYPHHAALIFPPEAHDLQLEGLSMKLPSVGGFKWQGSPVALVSVKFFKLTSRLMTVKMVTELEVILVAMPYMKYLAFPNCELAWLSRLGTVAPQLRMIEWLDTPPPDLTYNNLQDLHDLTHLAGVFPGGETPRQITYRLSQIHQFQQYVQYVSSARQMTGGQPVWYKRYNPHFVEMERYGDQWPDYDGDRPMG
ncbi:hypothetical protein M422DRAFT_52290 [Sphaerobolus stellatus SS14]|uniref:F-box domain-containing protein n=1 Tax=Sphaerobolus stellatus (strain SS14) TaxID=990650 RepID=A0A0C9UWW1_SPHS4|nr:hypothetical protein M422DRAFT_52290 [Sphaerobolus stellatus SS14]